MYEISYKLLPPQEKDAIREQNNQKVRWKEHREVHTQVRDALENRHVQ